MAKKKPAASRKAKAMPRNAMGGALLVSAIIMGAVAVYVQRTRGADPVTWEDTATTLQI